MFIDKRYALPREFTYILLYIDYQAILLAVLICSCYTKISTNEVSGSTSLVYNINYKSKFKGVLYSSYLVQVSSRYPDYDQQLTPRLFMLCYQVIRNELYFWFSIQSFHTILFSAIYKKHE